MLFAFFGCFMFFCADVLTVFFIVFTFLSFVSLGQEGSCCMRDCIQGAVGRSPCAPKVSMVTPTFGRRGAVVSGMDSVLTLRCPLFRMVVIGSKDASDALRGVVRCCRLIRMPCTCVRQVGAGPFGELLGSAGSRCDHLVIISGRGKKAGTSTSGTNVGTSSCPCFVYASISYVLRGCTLCHYVSPVVSSSGRIVTIDNAVLVTGKYRMGSNRVIIIEAPRAPVPLLRGLRCVHSCLVKGVN